MRLLWERILGCGLAFQFLLLSLGFTLLHTLIHKCSLLLCCSDVCRLLLPVSFLCKHLLTVMQLLSLRGSVLLCMLQLSRPVQDVWAYCSVMAD